MFAALRDCFQTLDPLKRLGLEDKRRPGGEMWREKKELTCLQWYSLGQEGGVRVCFGSAPCWYAKEWEDLEERLRVVLSDMSSA